jgi:hypothetical protein
MVEIIDVRRLIPDMGNDYNEANGWVIEDTHFSDADIESFINDATKKDRDEKLTKYYAAYHAITTWFKDIKLNDVSIKQNSLTIGQVSAGNEKLLELLKASKADLDNKISEIEGAYFNIGFAKDDNILEG